MSLLTSAATIQGKNITVSGGVSRVAAHLRITPTMVDDFLVDPVMGIYVIFGVKLDVFQAYATRITWWVPNVMDCSGFGTGKSFRIFLVSNLRAILIPGQQIVAYYQDFGATKDIYFNNFKRFGSDRAPLFAAQKGRMDEEGLEDGKDMTRGSGCYRQHFRNDSCIFGPAPNWLQGAKGQAGRTFNMAMIDEWTKVETMTPKSTKLTGNSGELIGGIDQQIIGRVRGMNFNRDHMLWGNHIVFTATAESTQHPGYSRYRQFQKEIESGNPNYAVIHSCFKDFSNVRTEDQIGVRDVEVAEPRLGTEPRSGIGKQSTSNIQHSTPNAPHPGPLPIARPCAHAQRGEGDNGGLRPGKHIERHLTSRIGKPFKQVVPDWNAIKMLKGRSRAHFLREGIGLWARDTQGFYSEDALGRCVMAGVMAGTEPEIARRTSPRPSPHSTSEVERGEGDHYFMGIDPAAAQRNKADDGGMAILKLSPRAGLGRAPTSVPSDWKMEYVWAYRVRGSLRTATGGGDDAQAVLFAQRAGDWSGIIHGKHLHFNFDGLMMDSQGGGQMIWPELNKAQQKIAGVEREVTPIAAPGEGSIGNAHYILMLFLREYLDELWPALAPGVDSLYTSAHLAFRDAVEHGEILFPKPFNERPGSETAGWTGEKKWALKNLDAARHQLVNIQVVTKESGEWDLTRNGSLRFSSIGKKDLAYSCLYAYVRALIWLKTGELEFSNAADDGEAGCYSA